MRITLICGYKQKNKYLLALEDRFIKQVRTKQSLDLEEYSLKNSTSPEQTKKDQAQELFTKAEGFSGSFIILLAENGKTQSSMALASALSGWQDSPQIKNLVFIIGGPFGIDTAYHQRADFLLSLSPMTFPADLARLLLLEQIYRSVSINNNLPYHKA